MIKGLVTLLQSRTTYIQSPLSLNLKIYPLTFFPQTPPRHHMYANPAISQDLADFMAFN